MIAAWGRPGVLEYKGWNIDYITGGSFYKTIWLSTHSSWSYNKPIIYHVLTSFYGYNHKNSLFYRGKPDIIINERMARHNDLQKYLYG